LLNESPARAFAPQSLAPPHAPAPGPRRRTFYLKKQTYFDLAGACCSRARRRALRIAPPAENPAACFLLPKAREALTRAGAYRAWRDAGFLCVENRHEPTNPRHCVGKIKSSEQLRQLKKAKPAAAKPAPAAQVRDVSCGHRKATVCHLAIHRRC
jgi:hypothetical protein